MANLVNLRAFVSRQTGELQEAIALARSAGTDVPGGIERPEGSTELERKLAWWTKQTTESLSKYKLKKGLVQPDWTKIEADLTTMTENLGEALLEAFDRNLGGQALRTLDAWPVRTGLSRSLLGLSFDITADSIRGTLSSGAPYTPYIQAAGRKAAKAAKKAGLPEPAQSTGGAPPGWKMQFMRRNADGTWTFDKQAYDARTPTEAEAIETNPDRKLAVGVPYQDLINKPARAIADAIGREATEQAVKEAPK